MANTSFPTILLAHEDDLARTILAQDLQRQGYLVLVARDGIEAIQIAKIHSRPIHLMVTSQSGEGQTLAAILKPYRPQMRALFLTPGTNGNSLDSMRSEEAMAQVRALLKPPGKLGIDPLVDYQPPRPANLPPAAHSLAGPVFKRDVMRRA